MGMWVTSALLGALLLINYMIPITRLNNVAVPTLPKVPDAAIKSTLCSRCERMGTNTP